MSDNQPGTALTRAQEFNQQLDLQAENFRALLPSHIPPEKFKRVVVVAVSQNPDLFNADRRSFFNAAQKCASDGLLPDGREAALVVFNTRMKVKLPDGTQQENWVPLVQFMPMIAGVRKRMRNSGEVTSAEAYVVYRNDKFFQKCGDDPAIGHEPPAFGADRGEPVGAYAIIRLKNGETLREVMDYAEIERVRSFSKAKDGPAWKNWWGEMARKTVLRRCSKAAPNSADIDALLARDDEAPDPPSLIELTAMEPEPQRALAEPQPERSYVVIDADGEEHEYASPMSVANALEIIFVDAKRRGRAALDAADENNRATIARLPAEYAERITALWQEIATAADPFGPLPLPTEHAGVSTELSRTGVSREASPLPPSRPMAEAGATPAAGTTNSPPAQPVHERNTGGSGGPAPAGEPDQSSSRPASSPGPRSAAGHPGVDKHLPADPGAPVEDVSRRGGERGEGSARPFATTDTAPSGGDGDNGDNRTRGGCGPTATTNASRSDQELGQSLGAAADDRLIPLPPGSGKPQNAANVSDRPQSDLIGDFSAENLTVQLPPRPTEGQLDHFARQMLYMIGEAPKTAQRIALIRQKNAHGIGLLKTGDVELYDELQAALQPDKPAGVV